MKRTILLILIFAVFTSTYARRVDRETARRVATTFVTQKSPRAFSNEFQDGIVLTDASRDMRFSNFYIFSYESGFVIVAADDCVQPILAYSDEYPFNATALPSNIAVWLEGYENEIQTAVDQHLAAPREVQAEWSDLLAGRLPAPKSRGSVAPLVHTHWDQGTPYNNMCPANYDGQAITGCVATAMAQVMRFWEFPYQGSGSYSYYHPSYGNISANFGNTVYNWDNMPDQVTASSPMVQQDAVATLMFHCGVSVEMDYGVSGSGAYSGDVPFAMMQYFSYSSDAELLYKDYYSNSAWINLLKDELNSSRPLYYSGNGSGGHAFVCDGYDENNYFHFNWGWSGYCDGYYQIGALDPGPGGAGSGSGSYNYYNSIIYNLHPDNDIIAPSNLTATVDGTDVALQWSSVSGATSYRVYRDNVKIATINTTSYSDESLCYGPHTYYVKAVTQIGAMSDRSNIVDVDIVFPGPVPTNLTYTLEGDDVHLSWTAPDSENALLKYGGLDNPTGYSYGYSGSNGTYWAQRYPKSTLAQYAGMAINQFSIYLSYSGSYMFYIYKGDETGAIGELLHQESFTVTSSGVKTLTFSPIPLDYENDLWVVMYAGSEIGYPAAYCIFDGDNTDACYISIGINSWSTVSNQGNYSWMMEISVTDGTYTYNIYRNETLIADHTDATSYVDGNLSAGYYQYFVTTNYYGGESDASNRVDVIFGDISIYSISLCANPSEGGTVTGGGSYYEGLNCTVHAEASHGYHFANWSENGVEVSTDKDYTFTVSADRALVANFEATVYSDGIVYVTQNGNGRMDGTSWDNATNNLQQAVDVAAEEGLSKVWVAAGTYPGIISIGDEFEESFDDGIPFNWTTIDADGDGEVWYHSSLAGDHGTSSNDSHSGYGHLKSESYCNASHLVLTPDNYLVSPFVTVAEGSTFSFWACAQDASWAAEHFGVAVSTTGNMNAEDFATLDEWTIGRATDWTQYSCDLSAYAGQQVYIAIRHFNCSDMFILCVDDASLSNEGFGCFTMAEGVNVYGGFAGYEDPNYDLSQRDFETNTTVLNGQNLSRVLYQPYAFNEQTVWDGFTIRNGFVEGDGGGAYLEANSKLQNCVFEYCQGGYGGAVYSVGTEFENCVFRNNISLNSGGAVYMWNEGQFVNCLFTNNEASYGGAGSVDKAVFVNCVFRNNTASTSGGAVYVWNGQLVNCLLSNNQARFGGAIYADGRVSEYGYTGGEFINCDIVSNVATYRGGGICNSDTGGTFTNCIVWGNKLNSAPDQVYDNGTFTYCAVESGISGETNISLSSQNEGEAYSHPRFVNPSEAGLNGNAENADWRLQENSICINRGDNAVVDGYSIDLVGEERIQRDVVDMGCYESSYEKIDDPVFPDGIVYVTTDGSGDGTSWENAMSDIQGAVNMAALSNPKPMVWIAGGTYPSIISDGDEFEESFEDGIPSNWSIIDADGDGFNWLRSSELMAGFSIVPHSGADMVSSQSYDRTVGALLPDNYLVSPFVTVAEGSTFSFWACAQDDAWAAEHFGVAVSTTGNTSADDFTTLMEWTIGSRGQSEWTRYSFDLSVYAGQQIYIAIRHFNCTDQFYLDIDDVSFGNVESGVSVTLLEGVNVYGGFAGTEPSDYNLSLRDFTTNPTVLDGKNWKRVLYQAYGFAEDSQTVWDGFTIVNGNSDKGGGAYLRANSMLKNCVFENCHANYGGAAYAEASIFENCTFRNNNASESGGAAFGQGTYSNCEFAANQAGNGGAVYANESSSGEESSMINCILKNNRALNGGAIYEQNGRYVNCLFANNESANGGGVFADGNGSSAYPGGIFTNCDMVNNKATANGGGVYCSDNGGTFTNCIVWGNKLNADPNQVYGGGTFSHCAVEGGKDGSYDIYLSSQNEGDYLSPRFVNPSSVAGADDDTDDADWHLQDNTVCINRGNNESVDGYDVDLDGVNRIQLDVVDMGCYESPYEKIANPVFPDGIAYVTTDGLGDGTSWSNALSNIQEATCMASLADGNVAVWVAKGTYQGNGMPESYAFTIVEGVNVYGGFDGTEPKDYDLSLRDFITNQTVLDGQDLQRVLIQPKAFAYDAQTVWDGFTITRGFDSDGSEDYAGGAYLRANLTMQNCVFEDCQGMYGGAVITDGTDFVNCVFRNNSASISGGAVYAWNGRFVNCLFANNQGNYGGAVYADGRSYYGYAGGEFINCDIVNNTAMYYGGGIYNSEEGGRFTNCIVWGNKLNVDPDQVYGIGIFSHCAVEGGIEGDNIIDLSTENDGNDLGAAYVRFIDVAVGNYQLHYTSSCVDAGNNDALSDMPIDLDGNVRIYGGIVDLGCYENQGETMYCLPPHNLSVSYITGISAYLTWEANAFSDVDHFVISYAEAAESSTWTEMTASESHEFLTGLELETEYKVRVKACCGEGCESDWSDEIRFTTTLCPSAGGDMVVIGNGREGTQYLPSNLYYSYSYTQQIYTADELEHRNRTIDKLSWQYIYGTDYTRDITIYIGHTDKSNFNDGKFVSAYDLTQVFSGQVTFTNWNEDNWVTVELDVPFNYNGISNLLIAVDDNTGWYGDYGNKFYTTSTSDYMSLYTYGDDNNYDPYTVTSGNAYRMRNNIQLPAYCDDSSCPTPFPVIEYLSDSEVRMSWAPVYDVTQYELQYKRTDDFEYISVIVEGTIYQLENLVCNTQYDVKLRTVCGEGEENEWFETSIFIEKDFDQLYVTNTGAGNRNGASWNDAFGDLQGAIDMASQLRHRFNHDVSVWVKEGTYYGNGVSSDNAFTMAEGVNVYGGFAGNETDFSERGLANHQTILDGQNAQRVLYHPNSFSTQTLWDGFTIRNGFVEGNGGGAYLNANSKLQNCVFENCNGNSGGAVYTVNSEFANCVFRNNTTLYSGTVYSNGGDSFINCLFANNQARYGGAVFIQGVVEFLNCDMVNNRATSNGGSIYNSWGSSTFTNCIIWGNQSNYDSDRQVYDDDNATFSHCAVEGGMEGTGNISLESVNDGTDNLYYARFINPENGDFRLMQNSACVNAGQPDFIPTHLVDLEGNPRIFGDRIDIGCYEYTLLEGFHFLGMTDANWNVNTNWLNNMMPSSGDEAFIDANCVLNEDVEIWKLTVSNGKSLSVPSGRKLTAGMLVSMSPAQLVIEDGGQLVNENNDVKATVRKDINGYGTSENDWYMIASPVTDNTNVTNLTANVYNLFTFDGSEVLEWRTQHDNPAISHKTGYLYGNQEGTTLEFKGTLAGTTDATFLTLADGGEGMDFPGFNMIGNPYPCNAYITDSYLRMNALGNGFLPGTGAIAPCESVFVDADNDGQTVSFSKTPSRISFVSLTVSKNRGVADDRVIVRFDDSRNLEKFMFNESNTKLYIPQDDKEFAVVSAAENSKQEEITEIPVNFKASEKGTYALSFDIEDVSSEYIHLIDNLTGADVDLLAAMADSKNLAIYTFEAKPSDYAARFKLVFKAGNNNPADSASWFAYISNGNLVIDNIEGQATMQIVDVLGRVINTEIVSGSYNKAHGLRAGLYMISLNGKTQKIVVE